MPWRKILFWSALAVTGLLVLTLGWLWAGDLGVIKPHVERWVAEKTGRELRIDELSIDLGSRVIIVAEGVTFADAEWTGREHMVSVGRAELVFDTATLFSPPFIVESINLANANVFLSEQTAGAPNWTLDAASPGEPADGKDDARSGEVPILLKNTLVQNLGIHYEDPGREGTVSLVVATLNQFVREDNFLVLTSTGSLTGQDYQIAGEAGTWQALLSGKNVSFDLEGNFDTIELAGEGTIDDLFDPVRPTLSFDVEGPNIDDLTAMLGLSARSDGAISINGNLEARDAAPMLLTLTADVGQTTANARIEFGNLADFSVIDADVKASGPDFGAFLALGGVTGVREAPFLLVADVERDNERVSVKKAEMVFGDTKFDLTADLPSFPSVDNGSVLLNVAGPDIARFRYLLDMPGAASGAFSIDLNLAMDDAQREVFELAMQTSHGRLSASGEIRGGDTYLGSYADVDVEVFSAKVLTDAWEFDIGDIPDEALNVRGSLEYVGGGLRTRRPMSASLGGVDLAVEGLVALAPGIAGTNLLIDASGNQLRDVTNPFTEPRFVPPLPFAMSGRMLVDATGFRFTDLEGSVGSSRVSGNVGIRPGPGIAGSAIEFAIEGDAFEELLGHLPELGARPGEFELGGRISFASDAIDLEQIELVRPGSDLTTSLSIGLPASRAFLSFDVRGKSENIQRAVTAVGGFEPAEAPWSLALAGERNGSRLRVDELQVGLSDAMLAASGTLEFGERLERTDFELRFDVPDMSRLGTFTGRAFNPQPMSFTASVLGANGEIRVDDMVATLGNSHLDGAVWYRAGATPYLSIDLQSNGLDFEPLLEPKELEYEAEPERPGGRLIPDAAMPFDALASLDGDFRLDVAEFRRGALYLYDVNVAASLADGVLNVDDVTVRARSGYLRARATLDPADGEGRAKVELIAEDLALGMAEHNRELQMKGDMAINLDATGNDLRTVIGNTNGIVFLRTTGGQLGKLPFLNVLYGDMLDNILSTINPFIQSDPVTTLDCIVLPVQITDGTTASTPASFVRTDKINITFKSAVDLKSEKLDINIRSTPRKLLTISAAELVNPYIKIVGTLGKPALAVDEQGVLITGSVAVATGGLSVLARAAWDRLARSGDPCQTSLDSGLKALSPRFPDIPRLEPMPDRPATVALMD